MAPDAIHVLGEGHPEIATGRNTARGPSPQEPELVEEGKERSRGTEVPAPEPEVKERREEDQSGHGEDPGIHGSAKEVLERTEGKPYRVARDKEQAQEQREKDILRVPPSSLNRERSPYPQGLEPEKLLQRAEGTKESAECLTPESRYEQRPHEEREPPRCSCGRRFSAKEARGIEGRERSIEVQPENEE